MAAALGLALLIEPVLALVVMVCVAPLKVLIETEAPIALPGDPGQWTFALAVGVWAVWRASRARTRRCRAREWRRRWRSCCLALRPAVCGNLDWRVAVRGG